MPEDRTHPLLEQVPLTVSIFVTLPTAATLPYTYKSMPSTLPPSLSGITGATGEKPDYVVSQSGQAAHPDDIIAACRALQAHITKKQEEAMRQLKELEEQRWARELAEKRRVAPGWLDSEARLLEPERKEGDGVMEVTGQMAEMSIAPHQYVSEMDVDQGKELDRAFGWK